MVDVYTYEPLDLLSREIRLFRFTLSGLKQQDLDTREIHIEIRTFRLHACPTFIALSYEWGADTELYDIFVQDRRLSVRGNLLLFLKHLRNGTILGKYKLGWIWADQICIAQHLIGERNHQVQLMRAIFSQATMVIAWLGAPVVTYPNVDRHQITGSSYWTRIWIVQELLLARKAMLASDGVDVDLSELNIVGLKNWASPVVGRTFAPGPKHFFIIWRALKTRCLNTRYLHGPEQQLSLQGVLRRYSQGECSDPRDKIFGLQAISIKKDRVKVDYGMSTVDLLHAAIAKGMKGSERGDLDFNVRAWKGIAKNMGLGPAECAEIGEFVTQCARGRRG
jgi:hypothetical protein